MAEEIRLSKSFIETELPQAPPLYVSVYLMTLAVGQDAKKVAERLKATETDVLYAWGYWKGKGYLQEEKKQETERPALVSSVRPDYSPRELALYIKNDKVRKLFDSAQKKLGKMLSQQDMSLLFSFYDWLGLPMEVIELLLSYCTASGHTGMRYIEKVAIGWAEEGVNTVEKAAEYIELRKTGYRSILQSFVFGGFQRRGRACNQPRVCMGPQQWYACCQYADGIPAEGRRLERYGSPAEDYRQLRNG